MRSRRPVVVVAAAAAALVVAFSGWTSAAAPAVCPATPEPGIAMPEPPRETVDVSEVAGAGRVVRVPAGGDVQAAYDAAAPGDTIELAAGATYRGPLTLGRRAGDGWIVVRSSAMASLPPFGARVGPEHAAAMPTIEAASGPAVRTTRGAHHVRFVGIHFRPAAGVAPDTLVRIGANERDERDLPHHIVFDRVLVRGDAARGGKRGLALNGRFLAVIGSHVDEWKAEGVDAQAIAAWNGSGPFALVNNHLEGSGENVMFGGADPTVPGLVPSDVEIRRNTFVKPLAWRRAAAAAAGPRWSVKNLLQLKNAQRVTIDGNAFAQNWGDAQKGFAIALTVRNQDGRAPWSAVRDVAFTNNDVRGTASGLNVTGRDDAHPSRQTERVLVRNNVFADVSGQRWNGEGRLFQVLGHVAHLTIEHNTGFPDGMVLMADGAENRHFVYRNNVTAHGELGVFGSGRGTGAAALAAYFPGAIFAGNVLIGGSAAAYPGANHFPASAAAVGFVAPTTGDFRLAPASRYRCAGTGGRDPGVDFAALAAARAGTR